MDALKREVDGDSNARTEWKRMNYGFSGIMRERMNLLRKILSIRRIYGNFLINKHFSLSLSFVFPACARP